jgi:hypothetical protein
MAADRYGIFTKSGNVRVDLSAYCCGNVGRGQLCGHGFVEAVVHSPKVGAEWAKGGPKFLTKCRCKGICVLCHIIHARAKSTDVVAKREEQPFECSTNVVNWRVCLSRFSIIL